MKAGITSIAQFGRKEVLTPDQDQEVTEHILRPPKLF
jgi:hypothetical protein